MSKKTKIDQLICLILGTSLMSFVTACGNSSGGGRHSTSKITKEDIHGQYKVVFSPLNSSISGVASGSAILKVTGDEVKVKISMKESPALTTHAQYIYNSSECPTSKHDTNSDGFIDPKEAAEIHGSVLIPLDGDLNSQNEGSGEFPKANAMGAYQYEQSASLTRMLADLRAPDLDLKDNIAKLEGDEELQLSGKIVMIHGIQKEAYLPGSVRSFNGKSERETLVIACGKIQRAKDIEEEHAEGIESYIPRDIVGM